jgi:hypothetical protein
MHRHEHKYWINSPLAYDLILLKAHWEWSRTNLKTEKNTVSTVFNDVSSSNKVKEVLRREN